MLIAIVSDTHNNYEIAEKVLAIIRKVKVKVVLHCGDIEDAETVKLFQGTPTHFVFGNCDTDREGLRRAIQSSGGTLHEPFGNLELAGRKIAWLHGDDQRLFRDLENSGHFDFLFHGHTHQVEEHRTGATRVINPGALYRARLKTFALLDLTHGRLETVAVSED